MIQRMKESVLFIIILFIRLTFKVCGMEGGVVVQWMSDDERAVVSYHIRLEVIVKT